MESKKDLLNQIAGRLVSIPNWTLNKVSNGYTLSNEKHIFVFGSLKTDLYKLIGVLIAIEKI